MKPIVTLLLALVPTVALLQDTPDADGPPKASVGQPASPFRLNDHTGRIAQPVGAPRSADEPGRWAVLAFYPRAATPGCTREMCSLRDTSKEFEALGVDLFGVSRDGVEDLAKFAEAQSLPFRLLSDPDGSVTAKFRADMDGRPAARRVTFIVDPAGVIRDRDESVKVDDHGNDLLVRIRRLQAAK